ncbi:MAG: ferredoxin family protein [Verrucomicrobium sp.]|jgi:Pyruvate/2-oxoacid:ferredoxin oxidoreductase delta subunit|nr:ferredoxin family protein [Verrucomicrobium sp.]
MALTDRSLRVVLYEGSGANPLDADLRLAAMNALLERGFAVTRAGAGRPLAPADDAPLLVLGRWAEGRPPSVEADAKVRWGSPDPATVADQAEAARAEFAAPAPGAWKPWFPVIDYDRCTNCMQCLSFCLFGVYGVDDGKRIQVQNNDHCKTNCPACSRVCPEAAIMFPKYKAGPINGDVVSDSDLNREKMKIDISALLGGDVYSLLRDRSERARSRFSKERDSDKALAERQKCLTKLAALAGDIPAEVLMSLPSPEEISRKAAEAAAKAEAARAAQAAPNA